VPNQRKSYLILQNTNIFKSLLLARQLGVVVIMVKKKSKGAKKRKKAFKKKFKAKKAKVKKKASKKAKAKKKRVKKAVSKKKNPKKVKKSVKKALKKVSAPKSSGKANLIVTYDPNHQGTAEAEVKDVFKKIGTPVQVVASDTEGLFKLKTSNAKKAVNALVELCKNEPEMFNVTHKYIPIDSWCKSEVADMQRVIKGFVKEIGTDEKWKMSLNKRRWDKMHGTQLILTLTDVIDRPKVDLVNPEKIVQVEIIGEETGISLLLPDEILEVTKIKGPVF
jgi:tRNA acetyltransferase TAN1